ncbi:sigma-70 family RNA polymerase sigma factor [Aneurinibacillus aneurinilyticus]|uniref:Sigma-70 family RNA polymerase sigma factor n=1 Tax=Aneurinibacillus aneurinilyticus TaxID=1391 RepID=A0A848CXS0_ANEAE|nr:sigma-70 family RNA polymerase sigma factor [Aneurinibacillus aneurinilyticus]MED0730589.1 sigma-70 family RNA polymerase sigma factor [Aneurinibacillus aneurinilyticus]NMF00534.1 sigma-70 family RNA polymerase sigma factor [Aneurinibacillus aneurinilyticus]
MRAIHAGPVVADCGRSMKEWDWTSFFEEYEPLIEKWLIRFPPGPLREEAKQEARIACWKRLPYYDEQRGMALSSYLFLSVKGTVINWYVREKRWREQHYLPSLPLSYGEEGGSPMELLGATDNNIEEELIWQSWMAYLSQEEARCITLHIRGGMTLRQVADRLGIPYERVKKQKQRAIQKLRTVAEEW